MILKSIAVALFMSVVLMVSSDQSQAQTILRFASEASRSDLQVASGAIMNRLLKEKTNDALEVKVFSDGSLGQAQAAISGTRGGTIDIVISGSSNFTGMVSLLGVLDIPFIFRNDDHAGRVLDGKIGQDLLDRLSEFGLKGLAYWHLSTSWRQLTNSRRPVYTPEDIKGFKIRTNGSPAHNETWQLLGANPVPMPLGELYAALEMKSVDAQEQQLELLYSGKFYEVQRYLTLTNHAYSPGIVAMNKKKFDSLSPMYQKAVIEAAKEAGYSIRASSTDRVVKIIAEAKTSGMQVVENVDADAFVHATIPVRQRFVAKYGGIDIINAIDDSYQTK
jgi:tripartite ATP-independent transporter DctP family solute receptor